MSPASAARTTTLEVFGIAFGTWQLGGDWGGFDDAEAIRAIRYARALEVNFFDTAQAYGFGASERLLGRALGDELVQHRDQVVIAPRAACAWPVGNRCVTRAGPGCGKGWRRAWRRSPLITSTSTRSAGPIPTHPSRRRRSLCRSSWKGKIRHVGVSNFSAARMADFARTRPVETLQPPYHLFRREIETEVLPYTREQDIGVLVYGPLAHGLLTGAFDDHATFPPDDWRSESDVFRGDANRGIDHPARGNRPPLAVR
jgi:aryl-alcohol dehydrogenase-like predicted oxidoreductase